MNNKQSIFIEFTTTDNCNCNCQYCFEKRQSSCTIANQIEEEQRQLSLLKKTCELFNKDKYEWLTISFWGGEPFLNTKFMVQLCDATYQYEFVRYHIYSNGTLTNKYSEFLKQQFISQVKNRIHIQLSYDGEPHHTLMRGDNSKNIFETADLLEQFGISFSFKATLSFDLLDKLPEIWQSYEQLFEKYGKKATYAPTLDTTYKSDDKLRIWTEAVLKVAKLESKFINQHGYPLWEWFRLDTKKANCMLGNSIHVHNDGNIYICHGCAYTDKKEIFTINKTKNITSFFDVLSDKYQINTIPHICEKCIATYCQVCHIEQIDKDKDPYQQWVVARLANLNRCKYYKVFGFISKLLKLSKLLYKNNEKETTS